VRIADAAPRVDAHAAILREERFAAGFTDAMIWFALGTEEIDDIISDIKQGLDLVLTNNSYNGGWSHR
jgi:O-acetylhomoserine/O-acetylserine sulfhydrylase-like pyridoxal-dependent enzyme